MTYLNIIFVIGLFCSALGTKENPSSLDASPNQRKIVQETLSDEDITISYSTDYDSSLNITAISQDNNPEDFLNIYHNIVQEITILGQYTQRLELYNQEKADIYDPNNYEKTYNTGEHGISINNGLITANVDLTVSEALQRDVDFTDLNTCSTIQFDAVATGETSLTWVTGSINNIKETVSNYPKYSSLKVPEPLTPLVTATGHDNSTCSNDVCKSSTLDRTDMSSYYVFDNVYVMTILRVFSSTSSTRVVNSANTTYSMQSVIHVSGFVQICSDGTL